MLAFDASTGGDAEERIGVPRCVAGKALLVPLNGAVAHFGVRPKTVKRSARLVSDGTVSELECVVGGMRKTSDP